MFVQRVFSYLHQAVKVYSHLYLGTFLYIHYLKKYVSNVKHLKEDKMRILLRNQCH